MKIKEKSGHRLVIGTTWYERLKWIPGLAFLSLWCGLLGFVLVPVGSVIAGLVMLWNLGNVIGNRVVVDKYSQRITVEKWRFLLLYRRRWVIPFSAVRSVRIDYDDSEWKVSIDSVDGGVEVSRETSLTDMSDIAQAISAFTETELVDNSQAPEVSRSGLFREVSLSGFFRKVKWFFRRLYR